MVTLEHVHDFVVHGGDGIFGKQQQQIALHRVILDPVVDPMARVRRQRLLLVLMSR